MSESVVGAKGGIPSRHVMVRHAAALIGVFIQFWGVTLLVELFSRVGDLGSCGYRSGVPCQEGSALLSLGAPAFLAGILLLGHLDQRGGWSGPVGVFSFFSYMYAASGIGAALAWNAFDSSSVIWSLLSGGLSLLPLWIFVVLVKGFFKGLREEGVKGWASETFWVLEALPQSKKKRRKLLSSRGVEGRRVRNGRLVPETRRERAHWALFTTESCVALFTGVLAGWLFIAEVSS
ncbi:hypothetical protein [Streptomyces pratensis]|uniref:hypothetical protein n=1 Tax=Streptomyces pratensis TaxID=1169025 RepID=UPI00301AE730